MLLYNKAFQNVLRVIQPYPENHDIDFQLKYLIIFHKIALEAVREELLKSK